MANTFHGSDGEGLSLSNSLTFVIVARIAVAAARDARTPWGRSFAQWIATKDQTWYGLGCVGFGLSEIPWGITTERQNRRKAFIACLIRTAATPSVEALLPWRPAEHRLPVQRRELERFAVLVDGFRPGSGAVRWHSALQMTDQLCPTHHIYQHVEGCMICRDR